MFAAACIHLRPAVIITTDIAPPITAPIAKARKHIHGPNHAPIAAINFTSPAPIPCIAHGTIRTPSPTAMPRSDVHNPDVPKYAVWAMMPAAASAAFSQFGTFRAE